MASPAIDLAVEATPIVATLPLEALYVDRRFQRPLNERRAAKIAAEFDPSLLGVLHVNARRKGAAAAYSVFDGQHRLAALRMLGQYEAPCLVHRLSFEDEALAFVRTQTERKPVRPVDRHRAAVAAKDHRAIVVDAVIREAGFVPTDAQQFAAIAALTAVNTTFNRFGAERLAETLQMIATIWGRDDTSARKGTMIEGLALFLDTFDSVKRPELVRKLQAHSAASIIRGAAEQARLTGGSGASCVALAILTIYNKQRTTGRLSAERIGRRGT